MDTKKVTIFWLLLILGGGLLLRVSTLWQSLWLDELHTAWTVMASPDELRVRAHLGNNGSFYFWIVRCCTSWWGPHEVSLRLPSLLASLGCVIGTYGVARQWRCPPVACLGAAALVVVDRQALFYAGEARPYALVQLMALCHLAASTKLLTGPRGWAWEAGWIASGVALYYLHCTAALFLAGEWVGMALVMMLKESPATHLRRLLWLWGLLFLACLPSWGLLQQIAARRANWEAFVQPRPVLSLLTLYPLSLYVVLPALVVGAQRTWATHRSEAEAKSPLPGRIPWVMVGAAFSTPLILAWVLTEMNVARLYYIRYVIAASVCLPFMSALVLSRWRGNRGSLSLVVVLLVFLVGWRTTTVLRRPSWRVNEDWRGAVAHVNQRTPPHVPLLFYSGLIETDQRYQSADPVERAYCEFPLRAIYRLREDRPLVLVPSNQEIPLTAIERAKLQHEGGLLLVRGPQRLPDVQARIEDVLGRDIRWGVPRHFRRLVLISLLPHTEAP